MLASSPHHLVTFPSLTFPPCWSDLHSFFPPPSTSQSSLPPPPSLPLPPYHLSGIKAVPKFWSKLNQNPVAVEASVGLRELYPLTPIVPLLPSALRAQVTPLPLPLSLFSLYITPSPPPHPPSFSV